MVKLLISSFLTFPHFGLLNAKAWKPNFKSKVLGLPERPARGWGDIFCVSLCDCHFSRHYSVPPFVLRSGGVKLKHSSLCAACRDTHLYSTIKEQVRFNLEQTTKVQMYSSTLSLTSTLDGVGWSTPRPGHFIPEKETRHVFYRRFGRPQGRSGRMWKVSPPLGFNPRTVHPVASRYTDWANQAHLNSIIGTEFKRVCAVIWRKIRRALIDKLIIRSKSVLLKNAVIC
jgi:hypothetical protein